MKQKLKIFLARYGIAISRINNNIGWGDDPFLDQKRLLDGKRVSIIFDIGANTGQTTAKYLGMFPHAKIHAFEPTPESFAILKESFASNSNVIANQLAIAQETKFLTFNLNQFNATNSLLETNSKCADFIDGDLAKTISKVTVKATSIDDYLNNQGIDNVDILKMDIQGSEGSAVDGAANTLMAKKVRVVYTEVLFAGLYESQSSFFDLSSKLEKLGYRLFSIYDLKTTPAGLAWADAIFVQA